jgi:short-subunit dehydrogenase
MAVYYASKAYLLSFSEALHQELKGSGIKVTALCPGPTRTEFFAVAGAADGRLAKMATDPVAVVRAGLDGLARNKAIVIPGAMNKVTAQSNRFLPRALMRRIVARIKAD